MMYILCTVMATASGFGIRLTLQKTLGVQIEYIIQPILEKYIQNNMFSINIFLVILKMELTYFQHARISYSLQLPELEVEQH